MRVIVLVQLGLDDVTDDQHERLQARGRPTRHNPVLATSNMVASLMCAADVLVSRADIVHEPGVAAALEAAG